MRHPKGQGGGDRKPGTAGECMQDGSSGKGQSWQAERGFEKKDRV